MSDDTDPIEDIEIGEETTISHTINMAAWDAVPADALGSDRRAEDLEVTGARIGGETGNERIVVDLDVGVKRVDPHTKPVFQTEERHARRSDTEPDPSTLDRLKPLARPVVTIGTSLLVIAVSLQAMKELSGMTINGQPVTPPAGTSGIVGMVLVVVIIAAFVTMLQLFYPRRFVR